MGPSEGAVVREVVREARRWAAVTTPPVVPPCTLRGYTDGACWPNPGGTATFGVVLLDETGAELLAEAGLVAEGSTNNAGEFGAAAHLLGRVRALAFPSGSRLTLCSDSRFVVHMLTARRARPVTPDAPYVPHFERARDERNALRAAGVEVAFQWVPREQNTRADALAAQAQPPRGAPPVVVMPFGRYASRPVAALPFAYLTWAVANLRSTEPWLFEALEDELMRRRRH